MESKYLTGDYSVKVGCDGQVAGFGLQGQPLPSRRMGFSDYWPLALAAQVLTVVLIAFSAWMNWLTYQHRAELTQRIAELEKQQAIQTTQPPQIGPAQQRQSRP